MNAKNALQEICQSHQEKLPVYRTKRVGGPPHAPRFRATVVTKCYGEVKGDVKGSKGAAEISAAEKALQNVKNLRTKSRDTKSSEFFTSEKNTYILVDLENVGCWNKLKNTKFSFQITPIFFIGKLHPLNAQILTEEYVIVIDSCIKDAVDIAIIGMTTKLFVEGVDEIVVFSRDHFAGALKDCCNQGVFGSIGELVHVTTYSELIEHFKL